MYSGLGNIYIYILELGSIQYVGVELNYKVKIEPEFKPNNYIYILSILFSFMVMSNPNRTILYYTILYYTT